MGIINRTNDVSEQYESKQVIVTTQVTAQEAIVCVAERPMAFSKAQVVCQGISGAPTGIIRVTRFGGASYFVGSTFLVPSAVVSGPLGISMPAAGSSLLLLQKNDVVSVLFGGSGAASTGAIIDVILQNTQDIKTWF
jgi:hypothetical protein